MVLYWGVSGGLFWCYREDFMMIGAFDESLCSAKDINFAQRLSTWEGKNQTVADEFWYGIEQ